jgi:ribosomal protein S18 acetylase RimI-like enzyme
VSHSSEVVIRDLRPADQGAAIELLSDAFVDFPGMQVIVGSGPGARDRLRRIYQLELEPGSNVSALAAESDGRLMGALTYTDSPGCSAMSAGRTFRFMRIAGPRIFGALRMLGRIEQVHPKSAHRHLPTVGVAPEMQGAGIGRALMLEFCRRCDADGRAGYLETIRVSEPSTPPLERFYQSLGFEVSDVIPVTADWDVLTMTRSAAPGYRD